MEWAKKRKIIYTSSFIGVLLLLVSYPLYSFIHVPPTCFDNKKNGTETGVDCGGGCNLVCSADVKPPRVVWAKAFPINGAYDVAAYMENVNTESGLKNAHYTIRVLDKDGTILAEKKGVTEIAPSSQILLFETGVTFSGIVDRVDVLFDSADLSNWRKAVSSPSSVVTKNQILKNVDERPRFDAVLVNTDAVNDVRDLTVSAVVYDSVRSPVGVSKTFVDRIPKEGEKSIFFTWPSRLTKYAKNAKCIVPVDTIFAFDQSIGMDASEVGTESGLEAAKKIAKNYLMLAGDKDKFGFVSLESSSSTVDYQLSNNLGLVGSNISLLEVDKKSEGGNLGEALIAALNELKGERHTSAAKKAVVLFTNGNPAEPVDPSDSKNAQYALNYAATAASDLRENDANIFTFGLGENINSGFLLNRIAGEFSRYFSTSTPDILQTIHNQASETSCPPENFITEIIITPSAIFAE